MNPDDIRLLEDLFVQECPMPPSGQPWVALFQRKDHLECYVFDGQGQQWFPDTKVATLSHDGRTITWGRNKTEKYRGRDWPQRVAARLAVAGKTRLAQLINNPRSTT